MLTSSGKKIKDNTHSFLTLQNTFGEIYDDTLSFWYFLLKADFLWTHLKNI